MLKSELLEIIANGENSGVEFKQDDVRPENLAKEIVAFANFQGGIILLGVEDDGSITGIQREGLEEWVMSVFREKVHPMMLPFYEEIKVDNESRVAVVTFPQGTTKPYVLRHNHREDIYIRTGSTSQLASREQQARLFETGGMLHSELLPVTGATFEDLDPIRLTNYLKNILQDPEIPENDGAWIDRLLRQGFLTDRTPSQQPVCTIAGLVLFGKMPRRFLKESGIRLMVFKGENKDYDAELDQIIEGPMLPRLELDKSGRKNIIDDGIIEKIQIALLPFIRHESRLQEGSMRREKTWDYPWPAIRELIINALVHRDWTRSVDIEINCFSDRFVIVSPGALQNAMTIEKMVSGQRSYRNNIITDVMRDYGYIDQRGMGIRVKVIPLMKKHNDTEPKFEAGEDYLTTVLLKRTLPHNRRSYTQK